MSDDMKCSDDYDIGWEKWIDAYDQTLQDLAEDVEDFDDDELDPEDLEALGLDEGLGQMQPMIRSIMTPFGILPLTEQSLASRHFKFWVGHTNFMLGDGNKTGTEEFESLIGSVLGVEAVDVLTSYRFRIAIGKMFKDRDVMDNVKKRLVAFIKGNENDEQESGSD